MVSYEDYITSECLACRRVFTEPRPTSNTPPRIIRRDGSHAILSHFRTHAGLSENVEIEVQSYARGGMGLQLWDSEGPLLTASTWIPGIPEGHVAIKNYSENEGCLEQLVQAGLILAPHFYISGFPVCRLNL